MTKSHAVGSGMFNVFHAGHVKGQQKLKDLTTSNGLEFPTLISLQDTKLLMEKLSGEISGTEKINDADKPTTAPIKTLEYSEEIELFDEKDTPVQKKDGELSKESCVPNSSLVVQNKLDPRLDLAALWQHLNGNQKSPEISGDQSAQNPIILGLQNVVLVQKQTFVQELALSIKSTKRSADIFLESAKVESTTQFPKGFEAKSKFENKIDEDVQLEKIPIKMLNVETHFSFNTGPSIGIQLAGAVTEHLSGEVSKLQVSSSKLNLDPNAVLVKSLHIQLIPESLGELKVLMHLRGTELTLKIEVSSKLAAMKLTEDRDLLKDLLEKAGFEMTGDPVLITIRSEQSSNNEARMNDQSQDKQLANENSFSNYSRNFGDENERQQNQTQFRNGAVSPTMRSQDLVETPPGRHKLGVDSNISSGLYL